MKFPSLWPVTNIIYILTLKPGSEDLPIVPGASDSVLWDMVLRYFRKTTYILLAFGVYRYQYEWLLKEAAAWHFQWVLAVCIRNVLMIHILYGGWHWFLYERQGAGKDLKGHKYNPNNIREDGTLDTAKGYNPRVCRFWATSGTLIESLYECIVLHLWATGRASFSLNFWQDPIWNVAWMLFVIYWRDGHFYFAHRLIHPYFPKDSKYAHLDLGRFLYRHVHSLHHKSYNTGPWSGLSMHPIEHMMYLSCVFVPSIFITQHPMHFLFNHFDVLVSPLPGHDGYKAPAGGGSHFHYLHHAHFECNYGTPMVPLDKLFGSLEDGSKYAKTEKKET